MNEEPKRKKNVIYLTGFMGSGKSTIGPILANTLGYQFVDIDRQIEQESGRSVSSIFADEGEDAFRALERSVLQHMSMRDEIVVSLGGGTVAHEENFRLIRLTGIMVYLRLAPEEAFRRMKHKTDRPMLKDKEGNPLPPEILENRVRRLLDVRESFYNQADIVVDTDTQNVGLTVDDIVRRLRRYRGA